MIRSMIVRSCRDRIGGVEVGEATTGAEAVALCRKTQPDVVLLDIGLPDGDGLDRVPAIREAARQAKIIVLSSQTNAYSLARIHRAEVHGFVDKNEPSPEILAKAIEAVLAGRTWFSAVVERTRAALRADPRAFTKLLSDREQEMLCLIGQGLTNEEIGPKIGLSVNTVRNHRRNIMAKLGIHSSPELIRYALEKGFIRTA